MHTKILKFACVFVFGALGLACIWLAAPSTASAQPAPAPAKASSIVWDATTKTLTPEAGQARADFVFSATNNSDSEVTILRAQPGCGCTGAQMPADPWVLAPHAHGELKVWLDLVGKSGTLSKYVTVYYASNAIPEEKLWIVVQMPDTKEAIRARNMQMAVADRQAVFKGDCASCHVEKSRGKMAKELYITACGICHEPTDSPRNTMVTDLKVINHPTDYDYWKNMIVNGKPGTLMPAFGAAQGGPLTDEQVDSLAKTLVYLYPSHATTNAATPVIKPAPQIIRLPPN